MKKRAQIGLRWEPKEYKTVWPKPSRVNFLGQNSCAGFEACKKPAVLRSDGCVGCLVRLRLRVFVHASQLRPFLLLS